MKNVKTLAAGAALLTGSLLSGPVLAELSGNVGIASQYIFRGVSYGDPQVSGGVDWSHGSGLYAGSWISSAAGEQEVDFYGGWANELVDVGYIYYYFPDDINGAGNQGTADAQEVYASVSSGPFGAAIWYGFNGFNGTDDDEYLYVEGNLDLPLTDKINLGLHIGLNEGTGAIYDAPGVESSFIDYAVTLGFGDLYVMASAIDYDAGIQEANKPTFTLGYSWSFDEL